MGAVLRLDQLRSPLHSIGSFLRVAVHCLIAKNVKLSPTALRQPSSVKYQSAKSLSSNGCMAAIPPAESAHLVMLPDAAAAVLGLELCMSTSRVLEV